MTDKKTWDTSRFAKVIRDFNEDYPAPMHSRGSESPFAVSEDHLYAQGLLNSIVEQARDAEAKMIEAFVEKHGVMPVIRRWFDDETMSLKTELIAPH